MVPSPTDNSGYPASDPGFAAVPVADLLAQHADLIARLKICYGADAAGFEHDVMRIVRRFAAYVHLLPATADNYFPGPGGLFRLGLEVAFFSLQGTDAHIFSGQSTISTRRHLEPRWRLATFIAGLCSDCHRALGHILVTDVAGERWSGYLSPLADWLLVRASPRYFVRWLPQGPEARGLGVFAMAHIVPPAVLAHLSEDNAVIVPQLMASVAGVPLYREHSVMDELVRRAMALVIDRNINANADRYGAPQFGSHLERYLVDALRRLGSSNAAWVPNRDKSRVWFAKDGLFLLWPAAADDIVKLLEADQLRGIPKAPATILEVLLAAGVLVPRDQERATWQIRTPGGKAPLEAVRLISADILFGGGVPPPSLLDSLLPSATETPTRVEVEPATPMAQPSVPGVQMSLGLSIDPFSPVPSSNQTEAGAVEVTRADASIPGLRLRAPMRLNPAVRDALDGAVRTLGAAPAPPDCCTIADGLFVPLDNFERHGVPAAVAVRALAEARMLVATPHGPPVTRTRDFNGAPTVGLVIDPRFVDGLDLAAFRSPEARES